MVSSPMVNTAVMDTAIELLSVSERVSLQDVLNFMLPSDLITIRRLTSFSRLPKKTKADRRLATRVAFMPGGGEIHFKIRFCP